MPIQLHPVVVTYRCQGTGDSVFTLQGTVCAGDHAEAVETASLLATHWTRLRHGSRQVEILRDRISVGMPSPHPGGPTAYILTPFDAIHALGLPLRIDTLPGEQLGESLAGLDAQQVWSLVLDCRRLAYINTVGLTAIAAHVRRLRIHLCAVPEPVLKVFDIVGLTRFLAVYPDLSAALAAIPAPTETPEPV